MNTPPTTIEAVLAILNSFKDFPDPLQKSAEAVIETLRSNFNDLSEQVAKGMAEYERVEAEAFALLKRGGWLGMERHLTGPQVRAILETSKRRGEAKAHDVIREHFSSDDHGLLQTMANEWFGVPYLKEREAIIRDGLTAHRSGQYTLSIPALLPLAEGLSAKIIGKAAGRQNVVKALARDWRTNEKEVWTELYSDVVIHVIYENYDFDRDPAPYLNRNGILHGRVPDYGTELNSLRVFLLIDSIADRWREVQKKNTP